MYAGNGAARRAAFFGQKFALALFIGVFEQRHTGIPALLRAVVHQTVFADVEVARAGAATPIVFETLGDIVLKFVDTGERALFERDDFFKDFLFSRPERFELSVVVVQDSHRGGESKLDCAVRDGQRIFRVGDAAAQHRIDIDLKFGVLGQQLQFLVEDLQTFLGDVVGLYVVNADLQIFQTSPIQFFDAVGDQQVAVGDHARHDSIFANPGDDGVQVGMQ